MLELLFDLQRQLRRFAGTVLIGADGWRLARPAPRAAGHRVPLVMVVYEPVRHQEARSRLRGEWHEPPRIQEEDLPLDVALN
ncbi:hypothetical protein [Nocardioides mesophilus]|uniref:Uncharacterized protein n=1 Tax=Nocardioides mesophilus TaxID=433659 RepID=A0A7G9R891_9ACTN|nr:hypothetical protein [Nocardioides mesophilus]QNN51816.1 hypothetical protein H9L09_14890 [Nocardioides mesophilus]